MVQRVYAVLAGLLLFSTLGCRDLNLPPTPGPGSLQGTVAYVKAGRATPIPAGGALVELTRQGRTTRASDSTGFFRFDGITNDEGALLFKFVEPESRLVFQRTVRLSEVSAGYGRDVQLGTIVLGPTASVSGKVLRKDVASPSGHAGTLVFVPEGPALTQTADDGSFTLPGLPEGSFSLSMFRPGYLGQSVSGSLRAAEEFRVATVVLEVDPAMPMPATLKGRVLMLDGSEPSGVSVAFAGDQGTVSTSTLGDGTFSRDGLDVGLYQLTFSKSGYRAVTVHNVLATGVVDVGSITLVPGAQAGDDPADAGFPVTTDAGAGDAGVDAGGIDGGADGGADAGADAGATDAGFRSGWQVALGDNQVVFPAQDLAPVRFTVRDDAGTPVRATDLVLVAGPVGGQMRQDVLTTDSSGQAVADFVAPRTLGAHQFVLQQADGGGALGALSFTVVQPDAGVAWTLLNRGGVNSSIDDGGLGVFSAAYQVRGLAVASDGTLYFTSVVNNQVAKLSKEGVVTVIAGTTTTGGYTGNGGPAIDALLDIPNGLALDEAAQKLYVAEGGSSVVRVIDLSTGFIDYLGGRGNATDADYGDNGSFANAKLAGPGALTFHREGGVPVLYVGDVGHGRLRRVDLNTSIITSVLKAGTNPGEFGGCGSTMACSVAWLPNGDRLVSGNVNLATTTASGLLRLSPSGVVTPLTSTSDTNATTEGVPIYDTGFSGAPALAVNAAGDVFLSDEGHHTVRRLEAGTGLVTTVLGQVNVFSPMGNYLPGTQATLYNPGFIALGPDGTLYVADQNHHAIRALAGVGRTTRTTPTLGTDAGLTFSAPILQTTGPALARLSVGGVPLVGLPVHFEATSDGGAVDTFANTDTQGVASSALQAGLALGTYRFTATFTDPLGFPAAGNPVTYTLTATAPPAKTVLSVANRDHLPGTGGIPGPAPAAHLQTPWGLALGSDGSVYVTDIDQHTVEVIRPGGRIEHVAGLSGISGYAGDNGPAASAMLDSPRGVAVDASNHYLYIADTGNGVIRRVDLTASPPVMQRFAGWVTPLGPPNDGATAAQAGFSDPTYLLLRTEGATEWLYVTDFHHNRIARVKTDGTLAQTYFSPALGPTSGLMPTPTMCDVNGYLSDCGFTFDAQGKLIVSLSTADTTFGGTYAVVRWDSQANTLTRLVGGNAGNTGEGVDATLISLPSGAAPALMPNGDLVLTSTFEHRVRSYAMGTGLTSTLVGDGTPGFVGEYVVAGPSTRASAPRAAVVSPQGHVYFTDSGNGAVRLIW